jgi:hypothetical protein
VNWANSPEQPSRLRPTALGKRYNSDEAVIGACRSQDCDGSRKARQTVGTKADRELFCCEVLGGSLDDDAREGLLRDHIAKKAEYRNTTLPKNERGESGSDFVAAGYWHHGSCTCANRTLLPPPTRPDCFWKAWTVPSRIAFHTSLRALLMSCGRARPPLIAAQRVWNGASTIAAPVMRTTATPRSCKRLETIPFRKPSFSEQPGHRVRMHKSGRWHREFRPRRLRYLNLSKGCDYDDP